MARRPGDWDCPSCQDMNFASRNNCRNCGNPKPGNGEDSKGSSWGSNSGNQGREGDWNCSSCQHLNFARRDTCRQCSQPKEGLSGGWGNGESSGGRNFNSQRPGDWMCSCGELVFASRSNCRQCNGTKPEGGGHQGGYNRPHPYDRGQRTGAKPGDWTCSCGELVFASRSECRQCGSPKPDQGSYDGNPRGFGGSGGSYGGGFGSFDGGFSGGRPGDWRCPNCNDLCFASRAQCRRCNTPRP